jgi:hypothetical protein
VIDGGFAESAVEYAVPAGFESLGHSISRGPVIAPGEFGVLRDKLVPKLLSGELRVPHLTCIAGSHKA